MHISLLAYTCHSLQLISLVWYLPIPLAVRSKAWVCGSSIAGIAGLNPAEGTDIRLLWLLCAVWVADSATSCSLFVRFVCVRARAF